ncbi:MAG: hypothetical protein AB8H79_12565 [Myxococcota bacterium]
MLRCLYLSLLLAPTAWAGRPIQPTEEASPARVRVNERRIEMLEHILGEAEGERRAEMLFRLAEMYREDAQRVQLSVMEAWNVACDADPDACETPVELTHAHTLHDRALRLYALVLRDHTTYARADEARFALALGLLEREQPDAAQAQLRSYVRLHPQGEHAHLAWLQLGELAFDNGKAGAAVKAFRQSAAFKNGEQQGQALHRLAWALKNVGEDHEAVEVMQRALRWASTDDADVDLADQARRDLVRFSIEVGRFADIEPMLGQGSQRRQALLHAAARHAAQGDIDASVTLYLRVATEDPGHAERPDALAAVTDQLRSAGRFAEAVEIAQRLERDHRPNGAWARANAVDPDVIIAARTAAEKSLRNTAFAAHTEARKMRNRAGGPSSGDAARQAYEAWVAAFDDRDGSAQVHFALAELHYERNRWPDALTHYRIAHDRTKDAAVARTAAEGALHAAEAWLEAEPAPKVNPDLDLATAPPRALTEPEQALLDAAALTLAANTPQGQAVSYRSAYVLYEALHFEQAAERFRQVIEMAPQTRDAERAAHLIADMLAVRESWEALAENAAFYATQSELGSPAFRTEMAALARKAELKQVESVLASTNDHAAAAGGLLAWVDRHQDQAAVEVLSLALRDAAAHYETAVDPVLARDARQRFLAHPRLQDDPARPKQWLALGDDLERLAQWQLAGDAYRIGANTGSGPEIEEASWRAAVLLDAVDAPNAIAAWTAYLNVDEAPAERLDDARWRLAVRIDPPDGWRSLRDDNAASMSRRLDAALRQPDVKPAVALLATVDEAVPPELADAVGALRYHLADPAFNAFSQQRLAGKAGLSPAAERRHFARRIRALQTQAAAVSERYVVITQAGSDRWALAAAVRLAELQEAWAHILQDSDAPTHLTPDQLTFYRQELSDRVWARQDAAVRGYAVAVHKAFEVQVYTPETAHARQRLSALDPIDWPALYEVPPMGPWRSVLRPRPVDPELGLR